MALPTLQHFLSIKEFLSGHPDSGYEEWVKSYKPKKEKKQVIDNSTDFLEIWELYPPTANFTYRGMSFKSARVLRANKQVCMMLYDKAIASGEITKEEMKKAVETQINLVKEESFEKGQNKLEYLPAIEVWIRQGRYLSFKGIDSKEDQDNDYFSA